MAFTCKLMLWANSKIMPSRNLKIERLDQYLLANTSQFSKEINDLMFVKEMQQLEFDKVIDLDQYSLGDKWKYSWDYATISMTDSTTGGIFRGYYFITKKTWVSSHAVKLHFVLDTINTYEVATTMPSDVTTANKYVITNKSKVTREHKDRYVKLTDSEEVTYPVVQGIFVISAYVYDTTFYRVAFRFEKVTNPDFSVDNLEKFFVYCNIIDHGGHTISANVQLNSHRITKTSETDTTLTYQVDFVIPAQFLSYYWSSSNINYMTCKIVTPIPAIYRSVIDLQSEGVLPILYKEEIGELTQPLDTSWFLYYKTEHELSQESSNAVECKLIPEQELTTKIDATIGVKTASDFSNFQGNANVYYVYNDTHNSIFKNSGRIFGALSTNYDPSKAPITAQPVSIEADGEVFETKWRYLGYDAQVTHLYFFAQDVIRVKVNDSDATKLDVYLLTYTYQYSMSTLELFSSNVTINKSKTGLTDIKYLNVQSDGTTIWGSLTADVQVTPQTLLYAYPDYDITFSSVTTATIYDLTNYDRTLSTLIKIIKIPYCPVDYTYDLANDQFTISSIFAYDNGELVLQDINAKFEATIETNILNPFKDIFYHEYQPAVNQARNNEYETKLFHSDYYQIKFVYDSFSYTFPLEKVYVDATLFPEYFRFKFKMTSTMNSKFAFLFDDIVYRYATEDYPNVLCVSRNNEEVIYNSTYLNYLRTAYNYDLKAKERTETASTIGTALTIVGSVAGVGLAIATENPALIITSILGATSAITTSVINNVNTIAQQEANQESKLKQLQAQSVSVAGSDDVDIMSAYCDNRAKLCVYKVSERMKNALADLFFYTGYATNEMKIPNFNTRYYFNFIAMIPDIINICNLSEEIINDIKTRWSNGVTIIHGQASQWNLAQDKENWEVSLL